MFATIYLIVGLGNPGIQYEKTHHNMGFLFVDYLKKTLGFPEYKTRFDALYTEGDISENKVIIIKPQIYMNSSGYVVQQFKSFYKIPSKNVFVIHDDLDLKSCEVKIKFAGSSGGHNGIRNIDKLVNNNYWRIRIGIGRPENKEMDIKDYVLAKFSDDQLKISLPKVFKVLAENIENLLTIHGDKTQIISHIKSELKK